MITPFHNEVKQRFGPFFAEKFLVMVDERAGGAEIIEQCLARGTTEWDAINSYRVGGAVTGCLVEGTSITLRAKLGRSPENFGIASDKIWGAGS